MKLILSVLHGAWFGFIVAAAYELGCVLAKRPSYSTPPRRVFRRPGSYIVAIALVTIFSPFADLRAGAWSSWFYQTARVVDSAATLLVACVAGAFAGQRELDEQSEKGWRRRFMAQVEQETSSGPSAEKGQQTTPDQPGTT